MQGIYGICEPGALLRRSDMVPMAAAMGTDPIGELFAAGNGAMLASNGCLSTPSMAAAYGLRIAVDADLTNYTALVSEHKTVYGESPKSLLDVLAGLYLRDTEDCLAKLEGAFSIAIWDSDRRRLLLAVDRHSFKVLYWTIEDGRLLFASRLSALKAALQSVEINPAAVMQFLVHSIVPAPLTIYKGVQRLEPGVRLSYERGRVRVDRYWDMQYEESHTRSVRQWKQELQDCMRRSVHTHLEGCDPDRSGAYLSGGTDSSSVLAFATEKYSPFHTFSIYFENRRYDEIGFARTAAEHFHARYHEKCLQPADAAEAIPKLVGYYEEPFANSSAIGGYWCARLARDTGVETLLAGDGGDELFAGNERYATDKKFGLYKALPEIVRETVLKKAVTCLPSDGPLSWPARYIRRAALDNPGRMFSYNFFLTPDGLDALDPEFALQANADSALDIAKLHYDAAPSAQSELNRLLYLDVKMTLADNDLRKVTGTAELAGVRVRFPLLNREISELSGCVPTGLKLKGFTKRYIFKQAMKGILPDRILYKKKHGFGVPVGYWLTSDPKLQAIAAILEEPETRNRGYFQRTFISRLGELNRLHPAYYGEVLWLVLMLELWHRRSQDSLPIRGVVAQIGAERAS